MLVVCLSFLWLERELEKNRDLLNSLDEYFKKKVAIPRIRRGSHQEIETLISEEALLLARYARGKLSSWNPRIVSLF